jgi:uncharacterized membrane protein YkvA (DUF1232 family)
MSGKSKNHGPKMFNMAKKRAEKYIKNPEKASNLLVDAMRKADKNKGALQKVWEELMALFRLISVWATGEYTAVPVKTILLAIAAVIYFLIPIDLIPDFIPLAGFLDDASVIAYVIKSIHDDLDKFVAWEQT